MGTILKIILKEIILCEADEHAKAVAQILSINDMSSIDNFSLSCSYLFPWRRIVRAITSASSQTSQHTIAILSGCKFRHKQFWRIIFATRHIKDFELFSCHLYNIKKIDDAVRVHEFNTEKFQIVAPELIDETSKKKHALKSIIDTLTAILKKESLHRDPLIISIIDLEMELEKVQRQAAKYIKRRRLSDIITVQF